jgi:hypothetical protein
LPAFTPVRDWESPEGSRNSAENLVPFAPNKNELDKAADSRGSPQVSYPHLQSVTGGTPERGATGGPPAKPSCADRPGYEIVSQGDMYHFTAHGSEASDVWNFDFVPAGKQIHLWLSSKKGHLAWSYEEDLPTILKGSKWVVGSSTDRREIKIQRFRQAAEYDYDFGCDEKGGYNHDKQTDHRFQPVE